MPALGPLWIGLGLDDVVRPWSGKSCHSLDAGEHLRKTAAARELAGLLAPFALIVGHAPRARWSTRWSPRLRLASSTSDEGDARLGHPLLQSLPARSLLQGSSFGARPANPDIKLPRRPSAGNTAPECLQALAGNDAEIVAPPVAEGCILLSTLLGGNLVRLSCAGSCKFMMALAVGDPLDRSAAAALSVDLGAVESNGFTLPLQTAVTARR
jgi:hypothetical protein